MTRHQVLELLITRRIPGEVAAIEATIRAITGRIDAAESDEEYDLGSPPPRRAADRPRSRPGVRGPRCSSDRSTDSRAQGEVGAVR